MPQPQAHRDLSNIPAGPGAIEDTGEAPKPMLEGATDYEVVELHNPLAVDFTGIVGITRAVNVPFEIRRDGVTSVSTTTEGDVARTYGLSLKNPDHKAQGHIQQRVVIPSGKTIRLQGAQAQVIVRQLVNEIMAREGNQLLMADGFARNQVEQQVILRRTGINEIMDAPLDVQTQLSNAVDKLNEAPHEEAFAGLRQPAPSKADPTPESASGDSNVAATTLDVSKIPA